MFRRSSILASCGKLAFVVPAVFLVLSMLPLTWADQNPETCTDSGPALFIRTLRDTNHDGIPDSSFSGSVREGEVIGYVCRLIYDALPQCGYEGGQLRFDSPPSATTFVDVTGGTIPLLCDDLACNPSGLGEYLSVRTDYVVSHSDGNSLCANPTDIRGVCRYENGTSHRDADEEFPISAETPACTPVRFCGDNIVQTTDGETCDPVGSPAGQNGNNCRADCTVCGDGHQDAIEACDDGNGVNTDGCRNDCTIPVCGDSIIDSSRGETCDPPDTPAGGNGNNCRVDCTVCGDGHQDAGEACDDGNGIDTDSCRNDCTVPVCGDGIINQASCETCDGAAFPAGAPTSHGACRTGTCGDPGCTFCGDAVTNGDEGCDDGNSIDTDTCRNNCTIPVCGDSIIDSSRGETCDPPDTPAGGNGNNCRADCTVCGDGNQDAGEACDDGNGVNTDDCRNDCTVPACGDSIIDTSRGETCDPPDAPAGNNGNNCRADCTVCGDGIQDTGEACDDGNGVNTDACRNNCAVPECGDGIIDSGETCDPPGTSAGNNGNDCRADCTVCGDGHQDTGEACDDGNGVNTDDCRNDCTVPACGDGIIDTSRGETCDPPATPGGNNGNDCRSDCTVCGDGNQDAGEACDDGNGIDTDDCRNDCTIPPTCGDETINEACETCDTDDFPSGAPSTHGECRTGACGSPGCTFCGDGVTNGDEQCDDGNDVDTGDTCTNDCHTPSTAICRTPGFWGTHAGTEKNRSVNITEAVLDCADGNCANHTASDYLTICGEKIDSPDTHPADGTTDSNDAASSTEALCVKVQGAQRLQLARQLTAAGLNCLISGGGPACAGTPQYSTVFTTCNSVCANGSSATAELTACISELDCLNNGGEFNGGICSSGVANNCHDRQLVNEDLGLNFEPPGPAGSSNACNAANDTKCTVVGPNEGPGNGNDPNKCRYDSLP